jgi:putative copper resistance protein D
VITPEFTLVLARMAQDFCAILLWGGMAYLAVLVPRPLSAQLSARLLQFNRLLAIIAFIVTFAILLIQSARLGEGWPDALNSNVLSDVLFQSSIGPTWFIQLAAAAFVLSAATLAPQHLRLFAMLSGLLLATRAMIGHAVILEGPAGYVLRFNYLVHVLAAGAWVGALLPVIIVIRQMTRYITQEQISALRNFSVAGHVAVSVVIVSGILNAVLILKRFFPLGESAYDAMLTLKIIIVAAMISIAIVNRYIFVPRLSTNRQAALILGILTTAEFALASAVLVVVNLLSAANPH